MAQDPYTTSTSLSGDLAASFGNDQWIIHEKPLEGSKPVNLHDSSACFIDDIGLSESASSIMECNVHQGSGDLRLLPLQAASVVLDNGSTNGQAGDILNGAYNPEFNGSSSLSSIMTSNNHPTMMASPDAALQNQFSTGSIPHSMVGTTGLVSASMNGTPILTDNQLNNVVVMNNTLGTVGETLQLTNPGCLPHATVSIVNSANGILNVGTVLPAQVVTPITHVAAAAHPVGLQMQNLSPNNVSTVLLTSVNNGQAVPIQITSPVAQVSQTGIQSLVSGVNIAQACLSAAQNVISIAKQSKNVIATVSNSMHTQSSPIQEHHTMPKKVSPIVHIQKEGSNVEFVQLEANNVKQVKPGVFTFSMPKNAKLQSTVVNTNFVTSNTTIHNTSTYSSKKIKSSISQQSGRKEIPNKKNASPSIKSKALTTPAHIVPALSDTQIANSENTEQNINPQKCDSIQRIDATKTSENEDAKDISTNEQNNKLESIKNNENIIHNITEGLSNQVIESNKAADKTTDNSTNKQTASDISSDNPVIDSSLPIPDVGKRKPGRPKGSKTVNRNTSGKKKNAKKRGRKRKQNKEAAAIDIDLPQHLRRKTTRTEKVINLSLDVLEGAVVESSFALDETIDELIVSKLDKVKERGWVCSLCNKHGYPSNVDPLYGPYELKITGKEDFDGTPNTSASKKRCLKVWLHRDCAIWTHSICLSGRKMCGIAEALRTSIEYKCSVCKSNGATLCCSGLDCNESYHYSCAKENDSNALQSKDAALSAGSSNSILKSLPITHTRVIGTSVLLL